MAVFALAACDRDHDDPSEPQEQNLILAHAGITNIITKAPVQSDQTGKLPQNDLTIFFARATDAVTADWTTVSGPQATEEGFVSGILKGSLIGMHDANNKGKIGFEESQYYNADQGQKSWFVSYYPEDNDGYNNQLTTDGVLKWTIDGKKDIMYSSVVSGDKVTNTATPLAFTLNHKLAWLRFQIQSNGETDNDGDDQVANSAWGNITSIKVKGLSNLYTLNLPSNGVFSGTGDISTWNASDNAPTAQALTASPVFFSQALVQAMPFVTDRNYTLLITTTKRTTPVEVPISLTGNVDAQVGAKHVITLTFMASEITATGQITPWTDGAPGSGTVQ